MTDPPRAPHLIVALDVPELGPALELVDRLSPLGVTFKVGLEAMYGYGDELLAALESRGRDWFADVKLHDIPRTVGAAVRALVRPHARILNVHALGGNDMMVAAVEAARERAAELGCEPPLVFGVTLLTSHPPEELNELGLQGGPAENAFRLAALARDARCAGVVCSVEEARDLKAFFGHEFLTLCPGIRPLGAAHGDQRRVGTPAAAAAAGADYVVVGRPIVEASDPFAAAEAILAELRGGR